METKRKYVAPTARYALIQGSFWGSFCVIFAYASVYLLSKNYSNSQIGILIAVAGGISTMLQPMVADVADRSKKITIHHLICFWSIIMIAVASALLIPGLQFLLIGIFYGIAVAGLQIVTPLVNAIGMESINRKIPVNFGIARGIGSITYAAVSFISGKIVMHYGTGMIPVMIIFLYSMLIISTVTFRFRTEEVVEEKAFEKKEDTKSSDFKQFFMKYRKFMLLLLGVTFSFTSHNLLNNYMFQVMNYHGGGSSEMGTALAIAATVELPTMLCFSLMLKKMRSDSLMKVSAVFFLIKAMLTLFAMNVFGVYLAQCAQIFGFALQVPASVYYVNALMDPEDRVKGQAFMTATNTAGSIAGSLTGGFMLDHFGVRAVLIVSSIVAFLGVLVTMISTDKVE